METPHVLPPRCAARFRLVGPLGKGGAGLVYQAIQLELDRPVALKLLHREVLAEPGLVERFKVEAMITASLTHPSIVRIYDHDVEDGIPWIAYELLPGPTLRQHLAPGPLPWAEALKIALQIVGALETAHAAGVLHRDVKPDNVLGAGLDRWKVTDFGIAKTDSYRLDVTQSGMLMGTPAYLAPEHITSGQAQPASDIYSLGVTLFEMITGGRPFVDPNPIRLLEKHLTVEPPRVSTLVHGVPEEVDLLVARALAKTPFERWDSAAMLRRAIAQLLGPDASFEMTAEDVAKMLKVAPAALAATSRAMPGAATGVSMGHLPPSKASGGLTSEGVRVATGLATVAPAVRDTAPPREVAATRDRAAAREEPTGDPPMVPQPRAAARSKPQPATRPAGAGAGLSRGQARSHSAAPMIGVVLLLGFLGVLLWPRNGSKPVVPDAPASAATPPVSVLPAWELVKVRSTLDEVIRGRDARDGDVKMLATYLNPAMPNFSAAKELSRTLLKHEETAYSTMQGVSLRLLDQYPDAALVPDADVVLYARVLNSRARAWCWLENIRITLNILNSLKDGDARIGTPDVVAEMDRRVYPPGLEKPARSALEATAAALSRLASKPALIDEELAELFLELSFLNTNLTWRHMDPNVDKRVSECVKELRQVAATLPKPAGPAIGRVAMALWDLSGTPGNQRKLARERVVSALGELGQLSPELPVVTAVKKRIERVILGP